MYCVTENKEEYIQYLRVFSAAEGEEIQNTRVALNKESR